MLKNYLKIALRNLKNSPGYSFINIFGLALGITAFILILLFIDNELSYDRYHEKSDRIYRVSREWKNQDGETSLHLGHVAPSFSDLLQEEFDASIQNSVRLFRMNPLISYEDRHFVESRFFFADPDVFEVFSWEMIEGDPATALANPDGIVITETTAEKYFGAEDPIGKSMEFDIQGTTGVFQVNGVMKDVPDNSHFQLDFLGSIQPVIQFFGGPEAVRTNFGSNSFSTFLLLTENARIEDIEARIPAFMDKTFPPQPNGPQVQASTRMTLHMWPITDIHLHSQLDSEIEANGNIEYVYIYTAVALFILFIACINFMNLSTARSTKRANEVGLRKVMGAYRESLIRQFMGESFLLSFIALLLAVLFIKALLPFFNDFIDKELAFNVLTNGKLILGLLSIIVVISLAAGSYPALFLSSFQPATVLKGSFKADGKHQWFRSALVVVQFTISIALLVSMGVVYNQLEFVRSKELGFNKDNIAVLPVSPNIVSNYDNIRQRLLDQPGIDDVSMQSRVPSGRLLDSNNATAEVNGELINVNFRIADIHVSHNFLDIFNMELAAGRNFDINLASDSSQAFVLNEEAITQLGYSSNEEAIGKTFNYGNRQGFITGVVKNFHFESLHQSIAPIVFMISNGRNNSIAVKFKEAAREETIAYLRDQWATLRPNFPFTYSLVEDQFDQQYTNEQRLGQIFSYFAILAIVIGALGLFGLASFTTQQRVKEIGVRKVLGASVLQVVSLLASNFAKLVFVAFLIATPIAYFGMNQWLGSFAYHIEISAWVFVIGGVAALTVAMLTISWQSIRAATANPVDSLRSE